MIVADSSPEEHVFDGLDAYGNRLAPPWIANAHFVDAKADIRVRFQSTGGAPSEFPNLQQAVDHAVSLGANPDRPLVIDIGPGFFEGPVILPQDAPPILLRGAGADATVIAAPIDAQMSGLEYAARFDATIAHAGAAAKAAFAQITARSHIGTHNTAVLRVSCNDVEISGITIRNDYACDRIAAAPTLAVPDSEGRFSNGQHQAVALMLDQADRIKVSECVLSSFQDTLYLRSDPIKVSRAFFETCHIEGDVDFIFGGASAFFNHCTIQSRGLRGAQSWALAPSTSMHRKYGFVLKDCAFTHDGAEAGRNGQSFLGRQWFEGVRATPYGTPTIKGYSCQLASTNRFDQPHGTISRRTLEAVGKALLIRPEFGAHLKGEARWDEWAAGPWSLRFRPVQTGGADFLRFLQDWLPKTQSQYEQKIVDQIWLSEV